MRPRLPGSAAMCLLSLLSACAAPAPAPAPVAVAQPPEPRNIVVLLADPDGRVGQVSVSNSAGSCTLAAAGEATRILDARTPPTAPHALDAAQIEATFGSALSAQPSPPLHYILYFEQGTTELTAESRGVFPAIVTAVRERASVDTSVVGHADTAGDARSNRELSLRRAMAIAALLAAEGIAPGSLEITSHGEANLLVLTGDDVAEPRNRRVEVTVR